MQHREAETTMQMEEPQVVVLKEECSRIDNGIRDLWEAATDNSNQWVVLQVDSAA